MTEFRMSQSTKRDLVTRTRKATAKLVEVVDFPSFSWTDEMAMTFKSTPQLDIRRKGIEVLFCLPNFL